MAVSHILTQKLHELKTITLRQGWITSPEQPFKSWSHPVLMVKLDFAVYFIPVATDTGIEIKTLQISVLV